MGPARPGERQATVIFRCPGNRFAYDAGMTELEEIRRRIREFRDARDWMQFHNPKNLACSIAIEAGELLEHFQWKTPEESLVVATADKARIAQEIADVVGTQTAPHAAYEFPRCTFYCGRWIRHGDWYPDRVRRLWRRGAAHWAGDEPHARLETDGRMGRLQSDLLHYSNESINWQLDKIGRSADPFVRHCLEAGRCAGWLDLTVRPVWKFLRAYVLRLGFLDGWPGYYIAWLGAFSTVTRYAKVREARLKSST